MSEVLEVDSENDEEGGDDENEKDKDNLLVKTLYDYYVERMKPED